MLKFATVVLCLALASSVNAQDRDYIKKNYKLLTDLSQATTCTKGVAGNTPATCPPSAGVPQTDSSPPKDGSTACVSAVDGKSYEAVFSLTFPSAGIPGCTSNAECGPNGVAVPGIVCGTNGPNGVPNTCWPLAPAACPFDASDNAVRPAVASAGRKMAY